jgi:hypothetical protein
MRQRAVNECLLEQPGGAQGNHAAGDTEKGTSMLRLPNSASAGCTRPPGAVCNLPGFLSLSRVDFSGEMRDSLHSRVPLPLIPPTPFSPCGRRGSLGILMPETGDDAQEFSKKTHPCNDPTAPQALDPPPGAYAHRSPPHCSRRSYRPVAHSRQTTECQGYAAHRRMPSPD